MMAHYAFLDENNIVTQIIVGKDENEGGVDWEQYYGEKSGQTVKRTSYNTIRNTHKDNGTPFRGNYAGVGFSYNETLDIFLPPKPYASWQLDELNASWVAPIPYPEDGKDYGWDEDTLNWIEIVGE